MAGWLGLFVFPSFTECSNFICFRLGRTSASRLELQILRALVLAKMLYAIHWINFFIFCFCFLLSPRLEMFCFSFPTELLFYVFGKELIRQTKSRDTSWLKIWIFLFFFFFPPSNQAFFKEKKKTIGIGTFYGDVLFGLDFLNKWFWAKRKGIREYITLRRTNRITKIASVFKVGVVNVKIIIWLMWQGAVGPLGRSGSPGLPGQPVMQK